jgi:NMD protein affecting ribosome stability and mRNA decay
MKEPTYACRKCGSETLIEPMEGLGICPDCCGQFDEHEYKYEPCEGHRCIHCFDTPPDNWFDLPEDVELAERLS